VGGSRPLAVSGIYIARRCVTPTPAAASHAPVFRLSRRFEHLRSLFQTSIRPGKAYTQIGAIPPLSGKPVRGRHGATTQAAFRDAGPDQRVSAVRRGVFYTLKPEGALARGERLTTSATRAQSTTDRPAALHRQNHNCVPLHSHDELNCVGPTAHNVEAARGAGVHRTLSRNEPLENRGTSIIDWLPRTAYRTLVSYTQTRTPNQKTDPRIRRRALAPGTTRGSSPPADGRDPKNIAERPDDPLSTGLRGDSPFRPRSRDALSFWRTRAVSLLGVRTIDDARNPRWATSGTNISTTDPASRLGPICRSPLSGVLALRGFRERFAPRTATP